MFYDMLLIILVILAFECLYVFVITTLRLGFDVSAYILPATIGLPFLSLLIFVFRDNPNFALAISPMFLCLIILQYIGILCIGEKIKNKE